MSIKRIIFFGTPDFAVATLKAIHNSEFEVAAVVTVPDKPAGRGLKLKESDVKIFAIENNLPVLQPVSLLSTDFQGTLKALKPDLQVVVAFKKLPREVYTIAPYGTINLHASLLPYYRGAAPINWAIINGEPETGVTTFFINDQIDEGHILLQEKHMIVPDDNAGTLYEKLKLIGADLTVKTLQGLNSGNLKARPQIFNKSTLIKKAPKIFKDDCKINWNKSGKDIINFIRGLSPYPGAFTTLISSNTDKTYGIKVYKADFEEVICTFPIGTILTDKKTFLKVVVIDGLVSLQYIQMTGRATMPASSFLSGFREIDNFKVSAV